MTDLLDGSPEGAHLTHVRAACRAHDGVDPINEATELALREHGDAVARWVNDAGFALWYAGELTLAVHPDARGQGIGGSLAADALAGVGAATAWSHADHPAARRLAARHGFVAARSLWVMRRHLVGPLAPLTVPDGVHLTSYAPRWREELLRVNAAAFAWHPEQGSMDATNLAERMRQDWWDPTGLILATEGDRLLGFHWTKRHGEGAGEVYLVAVDPAAQGRGIGRLITQAGLQHLVTHGIERIHLYVESDNAAAIATYSALGFTHAPQDTHVHYRRD